jgi:anti-sigma factor RsiW
MCPDKQLLSVYCDGEVPSPWKEQLDSHIEECASCRAALNRYRALGRALKSADTSADFSAAFSRVRENALASIRRPSLWKKRVNLPFAAACAAALVIFGGGMILSVFTRTAPPVPSFAENRSRRPLNAANIKNMNQLLEMLAESGGEGDVTITLPDVQNFQVHGKPVFLHEADYSRAGNIR